MEMRIGLKLGSNTIIAEVLVASLGCVCASYPAMSFKHKTIITKFNYFIIRNKGKRQHFTFNGSPYYFVFVTIGYFMLKNDQFAQKQKKTFEKPSNCVG